MTKTTEDKARNYKAAEAEAEAAAKERDAAAWSTWAEKNSGQKLTIGRGKVVWTLTGLMFKGGDPMACLKRTQETRDQFGRRGTFVRLAPAERMKLSAPATRQPR